MDLNTHRKQKNSTIVPQQGRATSQNFSEGERREKHLITSNPCEPFWSPKVLGCPRPCVCSVSGNDLPLHKRCSVLQRGCLPRSCAAPFLVNSSFPGLPLAGAVWTGLVAGGQSPGTPRPWPPGLLRGSQGLAQTGAASQRWRLWQKGQLFSLLLGESILQLSYKAAVMKHTTGLKPGDRSGTLWAKTG